MVAGDALKHRELSGLVRSEPGTHVAEDSGVSDVAICKIFKTLHQDKQMKVLVATPEPQEWRHLPVSTAAGLEA